MLIILVFISIHFSKKLYSTTGRPILGLNELDEFKFKKFRDNLKARQMLNSTAIKLKSPKSVKLFEEQNISPENKPIDKKEQIIPSTKNVSEKIHTITSSENVKTDINNVSLEDGEIITDDETHQNTETADDDCIFVERKVEQIIIDEDEDSNAACYFEDVSTTSFVDLTLTGQLMPSNVSNRHSRSLNNEDIIILDDTIVQNESKSPLAKNTSMDESVMFVSETMPDFIPLVSDNVKKPLKITPDPVQSIPKKKKQRDSLFSSSEKKQLQAYNVNAYNPNASEQREQRQQNPKRMVIVDGSNVAFAHSRKQQFSVKGLQICIEYFKKMGHEVKAVIPLYRLHKMKSTDPAALEKMHKEGTVVLTPCKNLPGLSSSSYDDRFILQLASELDAAVVSNDNYRDLINENSAFKKLIENRVIGYTWCDDVFMLPKDPYGKFGPTLHSILNRQIVTDSS